MFTDSKSLPHNSDQIKSPPRRQINLLGAENFLPIENEICDRYVSHMDELNCKLIALKNPTEKKVVVKKAIQQSRFHPEGQRKNKEKIQGRLGCYPSEDGILLTLTFLGMDTTKKDVVGISRPEAWMDCGYKWRYFMDRVNKERKARGLKKIKRFIRVMEDQENRGYPCPHIWFPGLKWLEYLSVLKRLWPYGDVDVKHVWNDSPANYICKYITKMEGRDFMQAMMFHFHLRLFSTSRDFKYAPEVKVDSGWRFFASGYYRVKEEVDLLIQDGYSMVGLDLIRGRGG